MDTLIEQKEVHPTQFGDYDKVYQKAMMLEKDEGIQEAEKLVNKAGVLVLAEKTTKVTRRMIKVIA